jgi:L-alanine-DL-glutamate epimerase-like enolase superfamily enzyme
MHSDIRILSVETFLVKAVCRTPLKFGAVVVDELPIGYVRVEVETRSGRRGAGWGAMFLMDLWAWPGPSTLHGPRNRAMCDLFDAWGRFFATSDRCAHPIELFVDAEPELRRLAEEITGRGPASDPMPFLAALVCASPLDHALHDAFGNANGIDTYLAFGPEHMGFDLSRYLGPAFRGVYPASFLRQRSLPAVPVFHLVGGLDSLRRPDVSPGAPQDGLPNALEDWIARDGVFCLKVKLRGRDMTWDLQRTREVSHVYQEVRATRRRDLPDRPFLTADTNEQCLSPDYIVEYLAKLRAAEARVYDELLYVEQPTERDLRVRNWDMRPIARLKPVLIDESLTTIEDFRLAMELGWSGIALKSCKCLSADLLFVPLAEFAGAPYAVQDLTNPSIALLESVGLAARLHTLKGVEANSRQFFPAANASVARLHPAICDLRDGFARTESLAGTGLGMRIDDIPGFVDAVREGDKSFRAARPEGRRV